MVDHHTGGVHPYRVQQCVNDDARALPLVFQVWGVDMNGLIVLQGELDRLGGLFAGRDRFFARGLESPPLPEAVRRTRVEAPAPGGEGTFEARAETPAGTLDPAFRGARWLGTDRPTLLYLQGSGERAFDFSPRSKNTFRSVVLDADDDWGANLCVLRAPFHEGSQREYARAMGEMVNFTGMLASLVVLVEELVAALGRARSGPVIVTGISLGGWATNLHAGCFGSADRYVPLLAGAALDDVFLRSSYRRLTAPAALEQPALVEQTLNFEECFRNAPADRVFPLLARHDQFIRYGPQARSYGRVRPEAIERGHVTAAASAALLRQHLQRHMP